MGPIDKTTTRLGASLLAAILWVGGCTSDDHLGSTCEGGPCAPLGESNMPLRCLTQEVRSNTLINEARDDVQTHHICLTKRYARGLGGSVSCEVNFLLPSAATDSGVPATCDDEAFLTANDSEHACAVAQLDNPDDEGPGAGEGWYYSERVGDCDPGGAIVFSDDAVPFGGISVDITCVHASVIAGDYIESATDPNEQVEVDPNACLEEAPETVSDLGNACIIDVVPDGGFDSREAYLSTNHPGCDTGACLVVGLDGDPSPGCEGDRCASAEDSATHVTCTCRCDSPEPEARACECGADQACVPLFRAGPYAGSYCVNKALLP